MICLMCALMWIVCTWLCMDSSCDLSYTAMTSSYTAVSLLLPYLARFYKCLLLLTPYGVKDIQVSIKYKL